MKISSVTALLHTFEYIGLTGGDNNIVIDGAPVQQVCGLIICQVNNILVTL